jgi:hypothetical protein
MNLHAPLTNPRMHFNINGNKSKKEITHAIAVLGILALVSAPILFNNHLTYLTIIDKRNSCKMLSFCCHLPNPRLLLPLHPDDCAPTIIENLTEACNVCAMRPTNFHIR